MIKSEMAVACVFLALGAGLALSSRSLPSGVAGLPGPGFFPGIIGILMFLLAVGLLRPSSGVVSPFRIENARTVARVTLLTVAYLALWGTGGFAVRTAVYLTVLLMLLGERWRRSLLAAAVITGAVVAAFSFGLGLRLD
jgi:hypothetical protein